MEEINLDKCWEAAAEEAEELGEDYINMEVVDTLTTNNLFSHYSTKDDFEFQSSFSSSSDSKDNNNNTSSPADELFYMGKLLPLHHLILPRLEMANKFLQHPNSNNFQQQEESSSFNTPVFTPTDTANATPLFQSCNASPSRSCNVSGELNPDEYFLDYPTRLVQREIKQSCTKRLNLINKSKLATYFKSFFTKPKTVPDQTGVPKAKACRNDKPFGQIKCYNKMPSSGDKDTLGDGHRRSFSGAFKTLAFKGKVPCKSSSPVGLKRSNSSSSEFDSPIQAAIAHCKKSQQQQKQQLYSSRVIISNDQERPSRLYRG